MGEGSLRLTFDQAQAGLRTAEGSLEVAKAQVELKRLAFSADRLPERTAATVLRTLGLDQAEAQAIARRPLPSVEPELKPI